MSNKKKPKSNKGTNIKVILRKFTNIKTRQQRKRNERGREWNTLSAKHTQ